MDRLRHTPLRVALISLLAALALAAPATARPIAKPRWLSHVGVTEYYPAPEQWFDGALVDAPGLSGQHRIDWLYSARGVAFEGDGIGLDRRSYHIDSVGSGGYVNARGHSTAPNSSPGHWSDGAPIWSNGAFWLSADHALTYPLLAGGWSNGVGVKQKPLPPGMTFGPGQSRPLTYYKSVAVDPKLIPLGSYVYIAAYKAMAGGGWFTAQDTGGAIIGKHLDVYRSPPNDRSDSGQFLPSERVYVVPTGTAAHSKGIPSAPPTAAPAPATPSTPTGASSPPSSAGGTASAGVP